jgi:hypothetical protein
MQIKSENGYDPPKIASFYKVSIPNSESFGVHLGNEGSISIVLGSDPYKINLLELLDKVPVLKNKRYWILENRWACVFYPDFDTPLFLNIEGKKFCKLCDGKRTVREVLENILKENKKFDPKKVIDDAIKFTLLLKHLKLVTIKN